MVFSQTSHKTQSILKVVELDRTQRARKRTNGSAGGVIAGGESETRPPSPVATTSFSEVYLKPEPLFESKMFNDPDCEFFQDLVPWCSGLAREELIQTTDSPTKIEESAHNTDTLHTPFSPQGWEGFEANSPLVAGYPVASTPYEPLSPRGDGFAHLDTNFLFSTDLENVKKPMEEDLDIINMPVFLSPELASEQTVDLNRCLAQAPATVGPHTHRTEYTQPTQEQTRDTHNKMLFFDEDLYFAAKGDSGMPLAKEINDDVVLSEYVIKDERPAAGAGAGAAWRPGLALDVTQPWAGDAISTPEVLTYVEELEKQDSAFPLKETTPWIIPETELPITDEYLVQPIPPYTDYAPITPKTESHIDSAPITPKSHIESDDDVASRASRRRRLGSADSDESYTPESEQPRKKRKKPNMKELRQKIIELEGAQPQKPVRRGRPPKRRDSTVSSVCSTDDHHSSISNTETKYRELRDKNNEASKRSRMNRKLKELQMETLAVELEERNQQLRVKADVLEDMTRRLKEALMTVILQKK